MDFKTWLLARTGTEFTAAELPNTLAALSSALMDEPPRGSAKRAENLQRIGAFAKEFIQKAAFQMRRDDPDFDNALCAAFPAFEPAWMEGFEGAQPPPMPPMP
jgi:hypothetical protein